MAAVLVDAHGRPLGPGLVEVDGLSDALPPRAVVDHGRVDPPLLRGGDAVRADVLAVLDAAEVHGAEVPRPWQRGAFGIPARGLGDDPVAAVLLETGLQVRVARPVVRLRDLDDVAEVVYEGEVARWEHLDFDDGEDAVEDVVVVDFAGDALLADVVDAGLDVFMNDGWKGLC